MRTLNIAPERFKIVHGEISDRSEPALRFYSLVAVSTLSASFGLIANSTAVVIGAMLVAPLMTPVFGISLALVRGEPNLLGHAARAEINGVVAAVTMGFVLGSFLGDIEPTAEMLSRARPNLFDLSVAVLAGFAGAYALVDEKISPEFPGVAISHPPPYPFPSTPGGRRGGGHLALPVRPGRIRRLAALSGRHSASVDRHIDRAHRVGDSAGDRFQHRAGNHHTTYNL